MTDWVGRDISHYRVTRELGQGGMGVVYLAEDLNIGRPVVLKVIRRELATDPRVEERFRREARACASVVHPNITTLFEVNRHDDLWYMCMEYVEGRTLRTLLSESGTLPVSDAVRIAAAAADALGAAHTRGIVHRDIKPENIMISEAGQVKVLDFGLAAFTSRSLQRLDVSSLQTGAEQLTLEGVAIGTLHYMSPEQARGAAVTPASDVFSLGAVLYETLAGLPPFRGDNSLAVMHSIAYDEPPPLASRRADVSRELEQVVRRALRKRPDERYESGASLRHDLLRLAGEEAALSPESGSPAGAPVLLSSEFLHDAVTDQAPRHFDARLVGREKELQALTARLDRALHGEGSLVLVSGEAGIGKTRLVSELARRSEMRGARYVLGRCVFREGGLPYHPFVEAADRLIAGLGLEDSSRFEAYVRERIPALAGRLPILKSFLQLAGQESTALIADKEHLLDAISALFLGFARERPMLLHIDDLHWADEATVDLLLYLARSCRDSQGLIVGTYRPEEVTGSAGAHPLGRLLDRMSTGDVYEEIRLGRLGPADTAAIVSSTVPGAAIESGFLLRLHEETAGNPFFVIETLKLLVESGTLRPEGDGWVLADPAERVHIPGRVHDVVARRLDRVSQADREVLEIASVEGLVFHSGALAACLGLPRIKVLGTLQRAEKEHHLIHAEEDQYSFDHPLIREILYEAIIPELRREYHRLIGEYLASRRKGRAGEEAAIAYQLLEAGEEEAALPFLVDAGERARHLFANAEAIALMNRAEGILYRLLDASRGRGAPGPPDAERARIAMRLHKGRGRLHQRLGDHERAMSDYLAMHRTAEAAGLADRQAHALTLMSELYHAMGEYDQAFDSARRAHDLAEISGDKRSLSNALRAMGATHFYRAEYDKALVVHNRSIELQKEIDDLSGYAENLNKVGNIHLTRGDRDKAILVYEAALSLGRQSGNRLAEAESLNNLGVLYYYGGDAEESLKHLEDCLAIKREIGDRRSVARSLSNLALVFEMRGDLEAALGTHQESLALIRGIGDQGSVITGLSNLATLHEKMGRYRDALSACEEALAICQTIGDRWVTPYVLNTAGSIRLWLNQPEAASELIERAQRMAREQGQRVEQAHSTQNLARVRAVQGAVDEALALLSEARELARELKARDRAGEVLYWMGCLHAARGEVAPLASCIEEMEEIRGDATTIDARVRRLHLDGLALRIEGEASLEAAAGKLREAADLASRIGLREIEWRIRVDLAGALVSSPEADVEFSRAAGLLRGLASDLGSEMFSRTYLAEPLRASVLARSAGAPRNSDRFV